MTHVLAHGLAFKTGMTDISNGRLEERSGSTLATVEPVRRLLASSLSRLVLNVLRQKRWSNASVDSIARSRRTHNKQASAGNLGSATRTTFISGFDMRRICHACANVALL